MEENRILEQGPLLAENGTLENPGYATSLLLNYDRAAIKASKWRIKEWDYYLINDDDYAVALTLGDLGYIGLISASVMDLRAGTYKTSSAMTPVPLGRFALPPDSSEGVSEFSNKQVKFRFEVHGGVRKIRAQFNRFEDDETLFIDAVLDEEPRDSMVIATPWEEDPLAFYYNQKILAMRASGSFKKGMLVHGFRPENSFGLLDWGRGVWTRDNTWFWSAAQGWQDGEGGQAPGSHRFGFNLGYGFGDTSAASENMVFLDGKMFKLGLIDFGIPPKEASGGEPKAEKGAGAQYDLMKPWHVTDSEGKLDLIFTPSIDRFDYTNVGFLITDQHQVFGSFSGKVMLDGEEFIVADLFGFAEVVRNKY